MAAVEPHLPDHPLTGQPAIPVEDRRATPVVADSPDAQARAAARVGLYVHVPFCARRCAYCDFSTGTLSAAAVERYLAAVEREAGRRAADASGVSFSSVFFGGGTPSTLSARHFARLWSTVTRRFTLAPGAEITLEANPESVRPALLDAWAAAGVNRLSMGAQSFDPAELERLGRIHDVARPGEAFALARQHGFRRLSLDLMFGFPGHGRASWSRTLESALALEPEHLSAYCFIPEDDTPLGRAALRGECPLPSAGTQAELYAMLVARLARAGHRLYETSNFARPGAACRHNLVYWLRRDYLGLGPSAHGLWRGVREGNLYTLDRWAAALERGEAWAEREPETRASRADEIVMLALRLGSGLVASNYDGAIWRDVLERYGDALARAVAGGRLECTPAGYRIAPRHRFVADDVIAWLMARAGARAHLTVRGTHP